MMKCAPNPALVAPSDIHVHTQQGAYGAGGNEDAGRVMEPRKGYRRGQEDHS